MTTLVGSSRGFITVIDGWYSQHRVTQTNLSREYLSRGDEDEIAKLWHRAQSRALRDRKHLFDAQLFNLTAADDADGKLSLQYGVTRYRDYACLRDTCHPAPFSGNPDPVGTAVIVRTADRKIPLGRRSRRADLNPGRFFSFGGFFDVTDLDDDGNPDIFACARRELQEESGLCIHLDQLALTSICYDLSAPHPEIAFSADVPQAADELRYASWQAELDDICFIDEGALGEFLEKNEAEFTPTLVGGIISFLKHTEWPD